LTTIPYDASGKELAPYLSKEMCGPPNFFTYSYNIGVTTGGICRKEI